MQSADRCETARIVSQRYSNIAGVAVFTIITTGIINTLNLVGSPSLLVRTEYGRLLSTKLLICAAMLVLAMINRFVLLPRFSKDDVAALKRNALLEVALGAAVLLLVATFGTMAPPRLSF
jgi:putative copper resistance protein D